MASSPVRTAFLAALLAAAACNRDQPAGGTPQAPPPQVVVEAVESRPFVEHAELTGRLAAIESVEVRPRISGHLLEVRFQAGEVVERDQVLFAIDPRWQQAELERRAAELAAAEARASTAEREQERARKLVETRAVSAEEAEGRASRLLEAQAALAAARAALHSAQLDLEFTEVRSPIRGRVSRALVTAGNFVSGQAGSNTLLTTVVSLDPLHLHADVDEATFLRFERLARERHNGTGAAEVPVEFALSDEQGYPRRGTFESLDNALDPGSGTILLRARVPNADGRLVPGLFVRARVPVAHEAPELFVDERAIGTQQNQKFVYVVGEGDVAEYRQVKLGPVIEGRRLIREGVQAGERVVVSGLQRVRPGTPVTPQTAEAAAAPAGH